MTDQQPIQPQPAAAVAATRPPLWRDVRVLRWVFQLAVVGLVFLLVAWLVNNVRNNSRSQGVPTGYDYLQQPASFPIPGSNFRQAQSVQDAVIVGVGNTLRVVLVGLLLATVLGVLIGIARLSGNWLIRNAAKVYVEVIRNVPLLILVFFTYLAIVLAVFPRIQEAWEPLGLAVLSNRGINVPWFEGSGVGLLCLVVVAALAAYLVLWWRRTVHDRTGTPGRGGLFGGLAGLAVLVAGWLVLGLGVSVPSLDGRSVTGGMEMNPEYFAILVALVLYTASHIAEIVRGSIQAVPKGQGEAANALALSGFQRMWYVVLPQAMRIAVPPLGNQYLNLMKNSSLGAAVSYFDITKVTQVTVGNSSPAVPAFLLVLLIYLVMSLLISAVVNFANRRLALP